MNATGEQPCYTLINVATDLTFPTEAQLKEKFEKGTFIANMKVFHT